MKNDNEFLQYDHHGHYFSRGPVHEFGDVEQTLPRMQNVGWSLGNFCPYNCTHCYSRSARLMGAVMTKEIVDRIVDQLAKNHIKTVNIGGNEPIFTNGKNIKDTLLPYIIRRLIDKNIKIGITTSGISLIHLYDKFKDVFYLINDVDISLDSPIKEEHNYNRGSPIYDLAIKALEICQKENKPHSIILAAMRWNFTHDRLDSLMKLCKKYDANIRINVLKPTEQHHYDLTITPDQYFDGFRQLLNQCDSVEIGEPILAALLDKKNARRCPCGCTSFRIHSITPDKKVYVSPCVYMHDYKSRFNLLEHDLIEIINSDEFRVFRQRNRNPHMIEGCKDCLLASQCGGGCSANAYLHYVMRTGKKSFIQKDPYCPVEYIKKHENVFPKDTGKTFDQELVHVNYLCTWIGSVR